MTDSTASGSVLFGKNSDRPAGETQPLRSEPARDAGGPLQLAYVTIDDAPAYAHVGSAPFWCWGYEIGVNEHRVAIGNEAVFTRPWADAVAAEKKEMGPVPGLLGMELVRLGLERGRSARAAVDVMTDLLARHGQWGAAMVGASHADGSYDNSFIVADPHEAWIVETAGREWAARRLTSGVESISNELTIRQDADLVSDGLLDLALQSAGWDEGWGGLDVAEALTDPQTPLQVSHIRRRRSHQLLTDAAERGGVSVDDAKMVLRDHLEGSFLGGPSRDASRPDFHTLCMHEHPSGFTWGNTAASMIVELHDDPDRPVTIWWSPVTPCTGVYLPVYVGAELPPSTLLPARSGSADPRDHTQPVHDPESLWWQWQLLLDAAKDPVTRDFTGRAAILREAFDRLEDEWTRVTVDPDDLAGFSARCVAQARTAALAVLHELGADLDAPLDPRWATSPT
ncbi:C69 family dipeptidase [Aeromicrobium endophyticum]|uniref:Dipeptidase n=1 Tax=Aeromicrobium endophyticum TaxID=2292704 RepID=A0A371PDR1_9ACTN|nr:C69 family dipeptidase [Aeromicrobium endophyticum]REK74044.1 secernin-2 [Aeromicrobium endophyticum]